MARSLAQFQKDAESMIRRWGNSQRGKIIRDGVVSAQPYMARGDYKPTERGMFLDGSERLTVSAVNLSEIDFERDTIEFTGSAYKINVPPTGPRPDGTVILFDCNVLRVGPATS
jgi:hypothetical protein